MSFNGVNVFKRWPVTEHNMALTGGEEQSIPDMGKYELICLSSFFVSFEDLRGVARVDEVYFIVLDNEFLVR